MRPSRQVVASALVSLSLLGSSMAARASTAPPPPPSSNAWMALSMLTPSGATALGETGVAAAQPETPPPPPPAVESTGPSFPPWPVIGVWLAVLAVDIYILTKNHHQHANSPA